MPRSAIRNSPSSFPLGSTSRGLAEVREAEHDLQDTLTRHHSQLNASLLLQRREEAERHNSELFALELQDENLVAIRGAINRQADDYAMLDETLQRGFEGVSSRLATTNILLGGIYSQLQELTSEVRTGFRELRAVMERLVEAALNPRLTRSAESVRIALRHAEVGEPLAAITELQYAIGNPEHDPTFVPLHFALGTLAFESGNHSLALTHLAKALEFSRSETQTPLTFEQEFTCEWAILQCVDPDDQVRLKSQIPRFLEEYMPHMRRLSAQRRRLIKVGDTLIDPQEIKEQEDDLYESSRSPREILDALSGGILVKDLTPQLVAKMTTSIYQCLLMLAIRGELSSSRHLRPLEVLSVILYLNPALFVLALEEPVFYQFKVSAWLQGQKDGYLEELNGYRPQLSETDPQKSSMSFLEIMHDLDEVAPLIRFHQYLNSEILDLIAKRIDFNSNNYSLRWIATPQMLRDAVASIRPEIDFDYWSLRQRLKPTHSAYKLYARAQATSTNLHTQLGAISQMVGSEEGSYKPELESIQAAVGKFASKVVPHCETGKDLQLSAVIGPALSEFESAVASSCESIRDTYNFRAQAKAEANERGKHAQEMLDAMKTRVAGFLEPAASVIFVMLVFYGLYRGLIALLTEYTAFL